MHCWTDIDDSLKAFLLFLHCCSVHEYSIALNHLGNTLLRGLNACPDGLGHLFREELSKFKWAYPCFWGGLNACPDGLGHLLRWGIKVDCRYIDCWHIAKCWFVDMPTVDLGKVKKNFFFWAIFYHSAGLYASENIKCPKPSGQAFRPPPPPPNGQCPNGGGINPLGSSLSRSYVCIANLTSKSIFFPPK